MKSAGLSEGGQGDAGPSFLDGRPACRAGARDRRAERRSAEFAPREYPRSDSAAQRISRERIAIVCICRSRTNPGGTFSSRVDKSEGPTVLSDAKFQIATVIDFTHSLEQEGSIAMNRNSEMMPELETMSLDDLKKLSRDVEKAIASFGERKRKEARKAMEQIARDFGLSVEEVMGAQKAASRKSKSDAKYRNPADASQTWSGRGRQPGWYKDALSKGKSPESMLV
jgi:DNA-binding protein H-NS